MPIRIAPNDQSWEKKVSGIRMTRNLGLLCCFLLAACGSQTASPNQVQPPAALAGSHWRLFAFQGSEGGQAPLSADQASRYEISLSRDGQLAMKLDCNRAVGRWSAVAADVQHGSLTFGALAMTRAMCPLGSLDARIARDVLQVRSYRLDGDFIHFKAGGDTYTWQRIGP